MAEFSDRANAIKPTGVRKMFDLAGKEAIHLGLGEPDFQPPEVAIEAFYDAMKEGHNKYTTTAGLPELRAEIAAFWSDLESGLNEDNVCVTMSGTNAVLNACLCFLNSGDNIMIPDPCFPLYGPHATITGAEPRFYPCTFENEFVPTIESLEELVDENTKAIIYNFPSNPTGATITNEQRDELLDFARRHDLWIITDEVYDRIIYNQSHVSFLGAGYDNVLMIQSFSKTFAMTGWRIGYIVSSNLEIMTQIKKMQYYITACSTDAMQYGVLAAIQKANYYPSEMRDAFWQRRDLICTRLNAMPSISCHVPEGAFYVFPKFDLPGWTSVDVALEILKEGVVCSPGSAFGDAGEGHLRFAYTLGMEKIAAAMDIVESVVERIKDSPPPTQPADF
ncbi:MAG: aminotransferase class I/II-fold pyridoxal phosphate-dependent enzyme [Euryarchaeota archaeon]|jgi:aspartate aminotransferase|nr:aminotransferase class I/II-fold pyridoxal phosphate-dependent enzyme [Euryarchaeota archaeon]MBT4059179.1 aminotransferase class I/II-fold pyridoxal phosphate-dependent enzyme [Euryarchaeota archaeon]